MIPSLLSCHLILLFWAVPGPQLGKITTYPPVQFPESRSNVVLSVDRLTEAGSQYVGKTVDVSGEVISDHTGLRLRYEDENAIYSLRISNPEDVHPRPDFEIEKDNTYKDWEPFADAPFYTHPLLREAKLVATLRGRYDTYIIDDDGEIRMKWHPKDVLPYRGYNLWRRLVLQKVINYKVVELEGVNRPGLSGNGRVLSVKEMKSEKYASQIVDVSGKVIKDYHGLLLCDPNSKPCVFVYEPQRDDKSALTENPLYEQFKKLSVEYGYPDHYRKEALFATLRGRFLLHKTSIDEEESVSLEVSESGLNAMAGFMLNEVLKLDIRESN